MLPFKRQKSSHVLLIENGECEAAPEIHFGSEDDIFVNEYGSGLDLIKSMKLGKNPSLVVLTQRD